MSNNYKVAKDLEGQVLTLLEAVIPSQEQSSAAKSIFRRLFHEWVEKLDVGTCSEAAPTDGQTDDNEWLAKITIKSPGKMTREKRKEISEWLKVHSQDIVRIGATYTDEEFNGRFMKVK